jgi:hypothetical protein
VLEKGFGHDVVKGFDAKSKSGGDKIDISALDISKNDFAQKVAIEDAGCDTIIKIGADTIELENVKAEHVSINDFII